jgi:hypothetical protein|tara:strand:+ start:2677 stop:2871 length:195 start_codon:yes stop_codon:yes gene_type:complete
MATRVSGKDDAAQLEERKVKALEKIAASVDALAYWFEDIDKTEWSERMQWYLTEYYEKYVAKGE